MLARRVRRRAAVVVVACDTRCCRVAPDCTHVSYSIIKQAVELDKSDSDIHRWYMTSVPLLLPLPALPPLTVASPECSWCSGRGRGRCGNILNGLSAFISTKESIANSYRIRSHWEDAISVNPEDATAKALLGRCACRAVLRCLRRRCSHSARQHTSHRGVRGRIPQLDQA